MIEQRYTLFTRIPLRRTVDGSLFCDSLWAKDLQLHLSYIKNFNICCPVEHGSAARGMVDITGIGIGEFFELRPDKGIKSVISNFLSNFYTVWRACKKTEVVHSDGAGWAFPLSFFVLPIRILLKFKWIIVIESSFWMIEPGEKITTRRLLEHYTHKFLLTRSLKKADARIFTQSFYKDFFLGNDSERVLINPATWVDEDIMANREEVLERFLARGDSPLRIIYPSRLEEDKGVLIVLAALEKITITAHPIELVIMGSGRLSHHCREFIDNYRGAVNISFKEPVDYGLQFFNTLAEYDFVLVSTLKQEQPRIIFDAFSQGVPVIGSDTSGVRDITSSQTALLFSRGSADSLAACLMSPACGRAAGMARGLAGLDYAKGKTHRQMHRDRELFLKKVLGIPRARSIKKNP